MSHNLTDVDIRKISLTGNEKRFNDLRTNFYKVLNQAETSTGVKIEDNRPKYTNFFKNLNKNQLKIPKRETLKEEKDTLFDMILTDMVEPSIMKNNYGGESVEMKDQGSPLNYGMRGESKVERKMTRAENEQAGADKKAEQKRQYLKDAMAVVQTGANVASSFIKP